MGNVEIPKWLKGLPFAPEFRPTDTEFADPIAYISKIEKEASAFGICKVIPPLPKPSKRYVFGNLNKSLSKCPELGDHLDLSNAGSSSGISVGLGDGGNCGESRAVFTTRHQELGQEMKKMKGMLKENPQLGVHKQVWQSGEVYTLEQFESKSKAFARSLLGLIKEVNPLVVETLFWKAASEKPICVEYANDVPGSGFGEPEGQFRYFRGRRRKRASYQSYRRRTQIPNSKKNEMDDVNNCHIDEFNGGSITKNEKNLETMPGLSVTASTFSSEETLKSSKHRSVNGSNNMEGTAGWKLSNSPWNLQVIARSPGSLTRYMPDDIPGVTSPMVYIGMLFSWFAWHVEDHELHSMNFLHTGSPKTWYAVPGDYAFAFEEVIRTEAYGGNIDHLAALTLLGEKTTLLSPEVVVASGIPCCRLIQNPGEFVVTFPRAYHLGFSHGFNCGEAANFGTPQWLTVAKEAAVRRAAMNYLPMLSHRQLLYLLTMSFVSRVPRSLLPGARSSRLRDRQKEERELSVKKAFIEDVLKENEILSVLGKDTNYNVVIWNPDLLPCSSKEPLLPTVTSTVLTTPKENASISHPECNSDGNENGLFKEMSLYMETLNDLYMDGDDLACDFQVDSGTLACVACGILGFPFMSVIQPSERASAELLPADHLLVEDGSGVTRSENGHSSIEPDSIVKSSVADDPPPLPDLSPPQRVLPMPRGWNTTNKFLRPRIFCLEHGVQIEELLQSKGGANMFIICHSDYQKIKAHATVIAEEIELPFNYNEVPLESASQEDLNLIDLAIDDEDHDECGEDWTSKLGINLRYCVKVRKSSPSKQVQLALALGGLFSEKSPNSSFLNIKWQSRRSRSRIILNQPSYCKSRDNVETKKIEGPKSDDADVKKEKLIQYSRRKYKVKIDCSSSYSQRCPGKLLAKEVSVTNCENLHDVGISGSSSAGTSLSPVETSKMLHKAQVLEASRNMSFNCARSQVGGSLFLGTIPVESVVGHIDGQPLGESNSGNVCNICCSSAETRHKLKTAVRANENKDSCATRCSSACLTAADDTCEMPERNKKPENICIMNEASNVVSEGQHVDLVDRDVSKEECSDLAHATSLRVSDPFRGQMGKEAIDKSCSHNYFGDHMTLHDEMPLEHQITSRKNDQCIPGSDTLINQPTVLVDERSEYQQQASGVEDKVQPEIKIASGSNEEESIQSFASLTIPPLESESSGTHREPCGVVHLCNSVTLEKDDQLAVQVANESNKEHAPCSVTQMEIDQHTLPSVEEVSKLLSRTSAQEDLCSGSTLDSKVLLKKRVVEKLVPNFSATIQDLSSPVSVEVCPKLPGDCAAAELSIQLSLGTEVQCKSHSTYEVTREDEMSKGHQTTSSINEELISTQATHINQHASSIVRKCSTTEDGSLAGEDMAKSDEAGSSQELVSTESVVTDTRSSGKGKKRKNEVQQITESKLSFEGFIRSPCEGLRPRAGTETTCRGGIDVGKSAEAEPITKRARKPSDVPVPRPKKKEISKRIHKCDLEGCRMSFVTKAELILHKRNQCTHEGCRKRFSSHKYAIIHQRVHEDDRPLKCPWKGCSMSFKWAWARTEHIRVHTGEKPYQCKAEGCGRSFRFVSDYSRHRRRTGHYVNSPA